MTRTDFPFRFSSAYRLAALPFGVTPGRCVVRVDDDALTVHYGPWTLRTSRGNVTGTDVTGPYRFPLTAGPPHLSLTDRGITFASNGDRGVCVTLADPVRGIEPTGRLRHPGLTVTVADVEGLRAALAA